MNLDSIWKLATIRTSGCSKLAKMSKPTLDISGLLKVEILFCADRWIY